VPEGDSLRRAAARIGTLVGQQVEVETPHPRAAALGLADRLTGRRLERVDAYGKNVLLRFEGGYVLRSHLRMSGRWTLAPRGSVRRGRPWLVLRGATQEAVLWNGPVLELHTRGLARLGPDILAVPLDLTTITASLRREDPRRAVGDALIDQGLVAGIGNLWKAEALWTARVSPWLPLGEASDDELRAVVTAAADAMHASVAGRRAARQVYRRAGRPCPRCGEPIRSRGQGDDNRTAYWCPRCQRAGSGAAGREIT
jgi:endonuclease-8